MTEHLGETGWAPQSCTLPTVERPVRAAEFDDLFARDVVDVVRDSEHRVRLELRPDPDVAARAAHLAVRETRCCSFFAFDLAVVDGGLALTVSTGPGHEHVLTGLATPADSRRGADA